MSEIIASTAQQSAYDAVVTLFVIDATRIEGDIFKFTTGTLGGEAVVFDGEPYAPVPCRLTGLAWNGSGHIPSPTFTVSNIAGQFVTSLVGKNNLVGAKLTIIKTFEQFLDDGKNPDPTARFPEEVFYFDQLQSMDNEQITWRLSALFDVRGVKLPRRQILREACTHRYRRWVDGAFDYSDATCPYVGALAYDLQNNVVLDPSQDKCSLNLGGCKARFANSQLPFRGFPGAARVRDRV
ncbi:hypothetical protein TDB9533_01227 [Thalassocella blandensis]|nr:hypothetical protein TDB9533_01227 [Thalassocella blandensis]